MTSVFVFPPKLSCYFLSFLQPNFGASNCFEARLQKNKSLHRQTDKDNGLSVFDVWKKKGRPLDKRDVEAQDARSVAGTFIFALMI